METRSCRDPGRPHDWRAVHTRYSRRTPAPHSAACPWRAHVFVVLVAPPAPRRTDTALLRKGHSCYRNCSFEGLSGWSATRTKPGEISIADELRTSSASLAPSCGEAVVADVRYGDFSLMWITS